MKMINTSLKTINKVEFFKFSNIIYSDTIFFIYTHFIQNGWCGIWHAGHVME